MFGKVDIAGLRAAAAANAAAWTSAALESHPPGPALAQLLAEVDPAELDSFDLVSFIAACERQTSWAQAVGLAGVRALAGRRLVVGLGGEPVGSAVADPMNNDYAGDEVAAALSMSRAGGQARLVLAVALARLPRTEALLRTGRLDLAKARAIVESMRLLNDAAALVAEDRVLPRAPEQSLANLRRSLARAVAAADPDAAARREGRARAERRVVLTPHPDGMCEFWALLPAADAMALFAAVTALADLARAADRAADRADERADDGDEGHADHDHTGSADCAGCADHTGSADHTDSADRAGCTDCAAAEDLDDDDAYDAGSDDGGEDMRAGVRSMDQARADVLADLARLVLDSQDLGRRHGRRPQIQVTVAASTLLGLDDLPGELAGYGPITAQVAREIAADATWRRLLTDPVSGGLLDYGRTTYEPPANLADHVLARDQTCRGPGCRIAAERCDIDHALRFPDGPTAEHNLLCECRHCHRRKHQAGWTLVLLPTGDVIWTTPTGHTYTDLVPAVLERTAEPRTPEDDPPPF